MFNRYSQRSQAAMFNPLSFEEYAAVPLMAQQKHDKYIQDVNAEKDSITTLPWFNDLSKTEQNKLTSKIEGASNKLVNANKGIYDVDVAKEIGDIRKYKESEYLPMKQKLESAALSRQELQDRYQKLVDQGYSSQRAQAAIMAFDKNSMDAYGKDGSIGYNGRILADDPDMQELGLKYAERLPKEETIRQTGFEPTNDGRWMNVETGEVTNGTPKEVMQMVANYLKRNQDVQRYLDDEAFLAKSVYGVEDTEKYKNDLINNAALASSNLAFRDTSVKFDMKNMTDAQNFSFALDKATTNVRNFTMTDNPYNNEKAVDILLNPESAIKNSIYDKEGNKLNYEAFKLKTKELLTNIQSKLPSTQEKIPFTEEALEFAARELYNGYQKPGVTDDIFGNVKQTTLWDDLVTSFKTQSGLFDLTSYDGNDLKVILDREFSNVFDVKPLTDSEKANMKVEANKKLQPLMEQYNASLPEGYPKANNIEEFKKVFKNQAENFNKEEIRTVDKNIETTDIVASEIKKGNFGDLLGKKIIIQKGDANIPVVSGDGKEAYDELTKLIKGNGKVGSITRIATGELAGGRGFKVTTDDGESYTVMTEPLSEGERDLFAIDQQISEFIQNPVNIGSGEELFSPYLNDEGFEVSMQPKKVYRNGQQQQLVDVRLYSRNEQGQRIRVDNGVEELDINQFMQLSEHQKKEWYKNHYLSNSLQNKSNPYQ